MFCIPPNIRSACPEKIAEFLEKKCEGKKKQNRRPRPKISTKADMGEVDLQLKGLMLSIESQPNALLDTTTSNDLNSLHNFMKSEAVIDLSSPSPPLRACKLAKYRGNIDKQADIVDVCKSVTVDIDKHLDVIDVCETSKSVNVDKHADVIDICDSETDASPEHEKKARELRLFISSIRKDLY